jgi:hypothetical protein
MIAKDPTPLLKTSEEINSLSTQLDHIREIGTGYKEGLAMAITWVNQNNGHVAHIAELQTKLTVGNDSATCFQPYSDIDKFYYEN